FANYQRTAYTVNFDLNGGDGALSPAQVPVGERLARPQSPSKPYLQFVGWTKVKDSGALWNFDSLVTEDMTLYARYDIQDSAWSGEREIRGNDVQYVTDVGGKWGVGNYGEGIQFADFKGANKDTLMGYGYTKVRIHMYLEVREVKDGYQYVSVWQLSPTASKEEEKITIIGFEHGAGYFEPGWYPHYFIFDAIKLSALWDNGVGFRYGADGAGVDDWMHKHARVELEFLR
ncbi:MAG: InlB B-repeat-containing protein, partial [Firmicutes bacterium]|nr:InlB B-repeat-containing protein [Bacillota bacterium]